MTNPSFADRLRQTAFTMFFILATCLALLASPAHALGSSGSSLFGGGNDFLPVDEALPFNYTTDQGAVTLNWNITPGHYLYQNRVAISAVTDGVTVGNPSFSLQGETTTDEFFGEVTVFYEPVAARVPVTLPEGVREATLEVTYQGCAEAGLCYPPQTREVLYYPGGDDAGPTNTASSGSTAGTSGPATSSGPAGSIDTNSATGLAGFLSEQSVLVIAGLFFLLGLGLTFTPCVLPMVPIISTLVSGHNTRTTGHALMLSGSYVLGMALTYAAAGVLTGLLGASFNLQAQLQSPWVLGIFATLFVVFALSMFDLFEIQLPRFIRDPLNNASHKLTGSRVAGIFGIGALSALIVSPCVSAPLAGSLLYISTTQNAVTGGIALFALGLGMGVPLILVAVGGRKLLPTSGHWMTAVKHFYGVMLLAVAIWLVERLVPAWVALTLWGLLIAITGVQLGAFDAARAGWQRTRKGLGLIMFAYGLALLAGAVGGANDPLKPLAPFTVASSAPSAQAAASHAEFRQVENPAEIRRLLQAARDRNQPVMLDFYADWCISCKVMERNVFSDAQVGQALSSYTLLQIDMTRNTPEQQAFLNELGLFGPPAILFYQADGDELEDQRILGEMDKREFLTHLERLPIRS
ncbi:thiol:disulfide interchange protein DsbD [Marinobacter pelagius]|uniref:Thiol:disulfide interchange protein DsbD n=1 Tax=Marinobacter pelagius TaxID=379482 RepID=A0A366GL17_9GAMM|nr:protein-disulfide reductase DsbD [Marinobacter pelagius]RBP27890.1 thiol:disulfide interchange protein DsbD [Marinobacter pelagius]